MKSILSSRRHHNVARVSIFLIVVALIVGMVSCNGGGDGGGLVEHDITITSFGPGTVTFPGEGTYTVEETAWLRLEATPDPGCFFHQWTGDVDTIINVNDAVTEIIIQGDYSIIAEFVFDTQLAPPAYVYELSVYAFSGGEIAYPEFLSSLWVAGSVVDLVAIPHCGYTFNGWTGDIGTITDIDDPTTTIIVNDNYVIQANFATVPDRYLDINSYDGGDVTSPGEGIYTYPVGTVVNLEATPDIGYNFLYWMGDVDTIDDINEPVTTITMDCDYSIQAVFYEDGRYAEYPSYALLIASTAGGDVTMPGEGTFVYPMGTVVDLEATPDIGYDFYHWIGDTGTITDVLNPATTITINGNYMIFANFGPPLGTCTPMIAAGEFHTMGLTSYYTVIASGMDVNGSCEGVDLEGEVIYVKKIAAGDFHSVGLLFDGTVVATGVNTDEQCNVGDWTDIIEVAAGGGHTVGVQADGTVVATGLNDDGQCNIDSWTDIVYITAGSLHTVGVKSNGTVVAVGDNDKGQLELWEVHEEQGGQIVYPWFDIEQVAAGGGHTVGIQADRTVVAAGYNDDGQCNVDSWTDIIQVAAGGYHTVGLRSDGTVVATGDNNYQQCNVDSWMDIIHVAAGTYHTVGLRSDGTVVAVGCGGFRDYGQCNVDNWDLIP